MMSVMLADVSFSEAVYTTEVKGVEGKGPEEREREIEGVGGA
jgi:hypothetical protein